ncbi:YqeB family protein [Niallia nealsonii]
MPNIADLLLKSPIVPFEKLVIYIANANNFWISVIAMVLGIIVGLIFTGMRNIKYQNYRYRAFV